MTDPTTQNLIKTAVSKTMETLDADVSCIELTEFFDRDGVGGGFHFTVRIKLGPDTRIHAAGRTKNEAIERFIADLESGFHARVLRT